MNWIDKIPPFESQYSAVGHTDAEDCVEESFCHIVYMLTGKRYSPRALALLTQVTPTGSSVAQCLATANQHGLIPYELWPTPDTFTWESYYADIPADVLAKAEHLKFALVAPDLNVSPLWTELDYTPNVQAGWQHTLHMVAQLNDTEYFDSELGGPIKSIGGSKIVYQTSIKIINQPTSMQLYKFDDDATEYVLCEDTLIGIASEEALAKITLGRPTRLVTLPAAQRSNFVIATGAYN